MAPAAADERLSVVVAATGQSATLERCLEALQQQRADGVATVIVVGGGSARHRGDLSRRFPQVVWRDEPGDRLTPQLWGVGLAHCPERTVAFLTATMIPDAGWARAMLAARRETAAAGVGGPIRPAAGIGGRDRAIYWLRYSNLVAPRPVEDAADIAGDNSCYCQAALEPYRARLIQEGFWEHEVNQWLRATGKRLRHEPAAGVTYIGGERTLAFAWQRLRHGRRFGAGRLAGRGAGRWLLRVASWPLTPGLFYGKIQRNARRAGCGAVDGAALPALLFLLTCWSVGELLGYLAAPWRPAVVGRVQSGGFQTRPGHVPPNGSFADD